MKEVRIYMDASNRSPRPTEGKGIYILECETDKGIATVQGDVNTDGMNINQANLKVLEEAVNRLKKDCMLVICAEVGYIASVESLSEWDKKGWKTSKGTEVANKEQWQRIWEKVKGSKVSCLLNKNHEYKSWMWSEIKRRTKNEK